MAWTGYNGDLREGMVQQPVPQQPTTIFQQMPSPMPCPELPVYPGHVKEDLVELMMIQNAQMHQVIMNNMTMSALRSFSYSQAPPAPETVRLPVVVEKQPTEVFHHYYQPAPFPTYITWIPPSQAHPAAIHQDPADHRNPVSTPLLNRAADLPPPPPGAAGAAAAKTPPATERRDTAERNRAEAE